MTDAGRLRVALRLWRRSAVPRVHHAREVREPVVDLHGEVERVPTWGSPTGVTRSCGPVLGVCLSSFC